MFFLSRIPGLEYKQEIPGHLSLSVSFFTHCCLDEEEGERIPRWMGKTKFSYHAYRGRNSRPLKSPYPVPCPAVVERLNDFLLELASRVFLSSFLPASWSFLNFFHYGISSEYDSLTMNSSLLPLSLSLSVALLFPFTHFFPTFVAKVR